MIDLIIEDESWRSRMPLVEDWTTRVHAMAAEVETALASDAALLLTGDQEMRELNARFRQIDKPTNVLAFPADAAGGGEERFLGDIAMSAARCEEEARERGLSFEAHATHLLVHGMLHLIGYDHQTDEEAAAMERRETEILAALGVADPHSPDLGEALERKA